MARTTSLKGKKVLIVEDQSSLAELLQSHFQEKGCDVIVASSVVDANRVSCEAEKLDVAIVDLYLPQSTGEKEKPLLGLELADSLRQHRPSLLLVGTSIYVPTSAIRAISGRFAAYVEKQCGYPDAVIAAVESLYRNRNRRPSRVFIVHGHNQRALLELKNYIQNVLKLGEPVVLRERASQGRTIIEKFEAEADQADLVFVLLTRDDVCSSSDSPDVEKRRARQNVIFELGYFYAKLQRTTGRVILLHEGELDIPSDMSGILYIDISKGIEYAGEEIRREVRAFQRSRQSLV